MLYQLATHRFPVPFRKEDLGAVFGGGKAWPEGAADCRLFRGIFGVASNEFITMTAWQERAASTSQPDGVKTFGVETLEPTARPKSIGPLPEGGIIVLRWFTIATENLDEFVTLSDEAWISMETAFDAIIIGLFKAREAPKGKTRMLLYTWYASLAEWERSRDQRPEAGASEAWKRFLRRHELTDFTSASVISEIKFP